LALRDRQLILVYTPYRVVCPRCGVRVERIPWARRWQRITHALSGVVSALAKELPWNRVGRHYGLNWKCVASAVRRAVAWGRAHRPWKTLRAIGIDEVARARGQSYLTLVYDLERRRLIWIGKDRTRETAESFFRWLAKRRGRCIHTVCLDMWAPFADAVRANLPQAEIVFDRFHVVKHLNAAVDEVRRQTWRSLNRLDRKRFKRTRWLWLKNPWNLKPAQKRRLSELCRRNSPIVRAYYLKEDFQRFWDYVYQGCAEKHLKQWLWWASHSRLEPFKRFARMIRNHWDGLMSWTRTRVSNGALEGMNSNVALIRHRSRGFRNVDMFIDNIYHCCANLPTEPGTLSG
jgi:transposase